jgi:hypothetical protein
MIRADVRARLTRNDAQLAVRLIARGAAERQDEAETTLRERGLDALLDDPRLLAGIMESPQGMAASYPLFCYVVVRQALCAAGERDTAIADYVSSILLHFGLRERARRVAAGDDQTYDTLVQLLADVQDADARRGFLVAAHLGNSALWLSGLFPDVIEHRRWRRGGPDLEYFEEMGQRGFRIAADHRLANEHGLTGLFSLAADRFVLLRVALNQVSDRFLFPRSHTPARLMRQVRDETRWHRLH